MISRPLGFICMSLLLGTVLGAKTIDIEGLKESGSALPNDTRMLVKQL